MSGYRAQEIATKKTYFCEYLRENENIFENILACESRDQVLLIHEKTRGQKSHATVPLSSLTLDKPRSNEPSHISVPYSSKKRKGFRYETHIW